MNNITLYSKINQLPDKLKVEANDFLDFLLEKNKKLILDDTKGTKKKKHPKAGFLKGTFIIKEGFDDPLEDFKDYM